MNCRIDHFVVVSPSLQAGGEYIRRKLGVDMQPGGQHPRMGTHNLLLRLGDSLYLEVISPDPQAVAPERPRWFGLDNLTPDAEPRPAAWVVGTTDIRAANGAATEKLGSVESMSRGSLSWLITIPEDGAVPLDGVAPALIQWQNLPHPVTNLRDVGLSLAEFRIYHPDPDRVTRLLASIGLETSVVVEAPALRQAIGLHLRINTLTGPRDLCCNPEPPLIRPSRAARY